MSIFFLMLCHPKRSYTQHMFCYCIYDKYFYFSKQIIVFDEKDTHTVCIRRLIHCTCISISMGFHIYASSLPCDRFDGLRDFISYNDRIELFTRRNDDFFLTYFLLRATLLQMR